MTNRSHPKHPAGFTLLEIVIALAILALSIPLLMGVLTNGVRKTETIEKTTVAGAIAESLLARAGTELPLKTGDHSGLVDSAYRWRLQMSPYGSPDDQDAWPMKAYQISVQVVWQEDEFQKEVSLTTLRLGPKKERQ